MNRDYLSRMLMPYAFQPICHLSTGEVYGYEALMRPAGYTPDAFLKAADIEHNRDASHKIELTTIFSALTLFGEREERLFINSFPNECLTEEEFMGFCAIFGKEKMSRLVVELLEYPYLDMDACERKRDQIRRAGCLFAVDDFGTGIADIGLVKALKPDIVKLDRSYIEKSREVYGDRSAWLDGFLADIYGCGTKIIIEGIETEEDLDAASGSVADFGQGYYYARPVTKRPGESNITQFVPAEPAEVFGGEDGVESDVRVRQQA